MSHMIFVKCNIKLELCKYRVYPKRKCPNCIHGIITKIHLPLCNLCYQTKFKKCKICNKNNVLPPKTTCNKCKRKIRKLKIGGRDYLKIKQKYESLNN